MPQIHIPILKIHGQVHNNITKQSGGIAEIKIWSSKETKGAFG